WFGDTFVLPLLPFAVPGPIALAGGGFVITGLAGFFDGIWHTAFGLDETLWSFPHSMLGWGLMIAFLGITSCRLALAQWRPIGWGSAIVFGFLVFSSSIERVPGPFMNNISPEVVRFIATIPVLAAEPAFQHTTRIYLANDITRVSPLFVPLMALGAGLAFGLLRRFDPAPTCRFGSRAPSDSDDRLRAAHRAGRGRRSSRYGGDRLALLDPHRGPLRPRDCDR